MTLMVGCEIEVLEVEAAGKELYWDRHKPIHLQFEIL